MDRLLASLEDADPSEVDNLFAIAQERMASDEELANALYETDAQANMGGQLFVREVELDRGVKELASDPSVPFFRLPFEEAIQYFASKRITDPEAFRDMLAQQKRTAFAVTRSTSETLTTIIKKQLDRVVGGGDRSVSLREFITAFRGKAPKFTNNYLETVVRTNSASAYNTGRWTQQQDPDVVDALPWIQYLTAGDSRVRAAHRPLHKLVWPAREFPNELVPPNGYNCRCITVSRTAARAQREMAAGNDGASKWGRLRQLPGVITPGFEAGPSAAA